MTSALSTMLVFADGLLFVGMMTPQFSPLYENVVSVFILMTLARACQVVAYKFMNEAFFMEDGESENLKPSWQQSRYDDPKQFALRIRSEEHTS